jgi:ADP-ribosylglycohydrolase
LLSFTKSYNKNNFDHPDILFHKHIQRNNRRFLDAIAKFDVKINLNRLYGCMFGLAIGDILGCPVEGLTYREIRKRYGNITKLEFPSYWTHWRLSGLHSDDTQQALVILEAFIKNRIQFTNELSLEQQNLIVREIASLYIAGLEINSKSYFGCWRGTGAGFRRVVEKLRYKEKDWPYGCGESSAGLGAVMRIPPLGIFIKNDNLLCRMVALITLITHTDTDAIISSYTIALACRLLSEVSIDNFNFIDFINNLFTSTKHFEHTINSIPEIDRYATKKVNQLLDVNSSLIEILPQLINQKPKVAINRIADETQRICNKIIHPTEGFAPSGVAACLYFFLHNINDPESAILTAINSGGDTDTIGAIVGSLCGTLYGTLQFKNFLPDVIALELIYWKVTQWTGALLPNINQLDLIDEENHFTSIDDGFKKVMSRLL